MTWCLGLVLIAGCTEAATTDRDKSLLLLEGVDASPATWSPDGSKVAVSRSAPEGILLVDSMSGQATSLAGEYYGRPMWSPDGKTLLVSRATPGPTIAGIDLQTANVSTYVSRSEDTFLALLPGAWHPEGGQFAYVDTRGVVVHPVGGEDERVIESSEGFGWPRWFPDGESMLLVRGGQVFRASLDGKAPVALAASRSAHVAASADGSIWYRTSGPGSERENWLARKSSAGAVTDFEFADKILSFALAPSTGLIAASVRGVGLTVLDPRTGEQVVLTGDPGDVVPVWDPAGRRVAFLRENPTTKALDLRVIAVR